MPCMQSYIEQKLNPTLLKALTALGKEKPTSKPHEAVTFLANWLLQHNPSKPHIAVPEELLQQQKRQVQEAQAAADAAAAAAVAAAAKAAGAAPGTAVQKSTTTSSDCNTTSTDSESDAQNAAAVKVQACFRGHQARREVAEMRLAAEAEAAGPA